ncbi:MAG TPA: ribonuclease D [Thermoanaerobaculia bacterium]|nr:ribonuclease D [Thermoanaerobaculia bacterium]
MKWIDRQEPLDRALGRVSTERVVAVDTEADSLHSYFDKVCLIQISIPGDDFVVDPLGSLRLDRFGEILADPGITKILHGADYDLRILNRDFGFVTSNLVDTMVCAQLLGYEAFGLAALLERHFGVKLNKAHQRADWAMRPLRPDMLEYAAMDTRHLVALASLLRKELESLGRWEWALEEFARLESIRFRETPEQDEAWRRMKTIGTLDRRGLAVLRDLHQWRDALARKADRPPFKIIGNDALIEIASKKPPDAAALAALKSVSKYHRERFGPEILRLVRGALDLPEAQLPERNEARPWLRDRELEARITKLKKVRDKVAADLKIDPGVLAPRHVLSAVAEKRSIEDIPALRSWQRGVIGAALLDALK